jgi:hypothetical protein
VKSSWILVGARLSRETALAAMAAVLMANSVVAQGTSPAAPSSTADANKPVVAEQADRLLKEMGSYIGSADQFTFHADVTFDQVIPSGQKLQFSAAQEVALNRGSGLYVEWNGDLGARRFWYDRKSVTLYDPAAEFYASASAPPDMDNMLNTLVAQLNFSLPLVDFMYRDPYAVVRENIRYGFDVGQTQVNGRTCRTLAFVEKDIDWQIWIENGPQPTPCKLVITYKTQPAQPQLTAIFSDWDFNPRIASALFTPGTPSTAEKIPFATVSSSNQQVGERP